MYNWLSNIRKHEHFYLFLVCHVFQQPTKQKNPWRNLKDITAAGKNLGEHRLYHNHLKSFKNGFVTIKSSKNFMRTQFELKITVKVEFPLQIQRCLFLEKVLTLTVLKEIQCYTKSLVKYWIILVFNKIFDKNIKKLSKTSNKLGYHNNLMNRPTLKQNESINENSKYMKNSFVQDVFERTNCWRKFALKKILIDNEHWREFLSTSVCLLEKIARSRNKGETQADPKNRHDQISFSFFCFISNNLGK